MTDYVISYDICALAIMIMFSAFYYSQRHFISVTGRVFNLLVILVFFSISFDLLSVWALRDRFSLPLWLVFACTQIYFLATALMAVAFCVYALMQTGSDKRFSNKLLGFFLFALPYDCIALLVILTPWLKTVFYFDEDMNYMQGPYMPALLVIVIFYLVFSAVIMFVFGHNMTFRKRYLSSHL